MRRDAEWAKQRFSQARVARLATVSGDGSPHVVPIVFARVADRLITAVDDKPKETTALRRLDNIAVNPFVSVLVDEYVEDWTQLWWARGDGWARVLPWDKVAELDQLTARYEQYRQQPPSDSVIVIEVDTWTGWSAS
jgi:PPOX class probable F420-dependent enzyme